jgi:hypothetical protein
MGLEVVLERVSQSRSGSVEQDPLVARGDFERLADFVGAPGTEHDTLKHTPPFVRPLIVGIAKVSAQSPGQSADQVVYSSTIS